MFLNHLFGRRKKVFIVPCNHPLKAFYRIREDGKKDIRFATYKGQTVLYHKGVCYSEPIDIPCGQCLGCRLDYAKEWSVRCMLEASQYEHNFFITLTYSPEALESNCIRDVYRLDENGVVLDSFQSATLVKKDLQKFMKDLRAYFKYHYDFDGIRFYACGEYGDKFMRPHFHLILFNCPIPDLIYQKTSFNGDVYWRSPILEKIWNKGFVCIANCNYNTCSYVARYMLKKQKGQNASFYEMNGIIPPFTVMSRDPGIAREFYDSHADKIYTYDSLHIVGKDGTAKKVKPPKYYDRLYDIDCPEKLAEIKEARMESAMNNVSQRRKLTSLSDDEYLAVKESNLRFKLNKLVRPVE